MLTKFLKTVILCGITVALLSFELPVGWYKSGSKPKSYEMTFDRTAGHDGHSAALIKSIDTKIDGFGTLMQECKPGKYLGKRVKMSAYLKSENVTQWAGLWLRVDEADSKAPLSFDNMQDRAVKGTTGWMKYEIVLDVPANATLLAYGALLSGTGQLWFDDVSFEVVDNSTELTGSIKNMRPVTPGEPTNLDFEK